MSLSELFDEFKYKPGDFVTLAMQTASLERTREITNHGKKLPKLPKYPELGSETYAEDLAAYDAAFDDRLFNHPAVETATRTPLPIMFQISSRLLQQGFGGVIMTEYHIEGEDGSKLVAHEEELTLYERPKTTTADVDTSINS